MQYLTMLLSGVVLDLWVPVGLGDDRLATATAVSIA